MEKLTGEYIIKETLGKGWGNSLNVYLSSDLVSFKIYHNWKGTKCYLEAIAQGSDKNLIIDIPFSVEVEERVVYYHYINFENDPGLSHQDQRRILEELGLEYEFMGQETFRIITKTNNLESMPDSANYDKRYSQNTATTLIKRTIKYNPADVFAKIEEAEKHSAGSIKHYAQIEYIGNLPE